MGIYFTASAYKHGLTDEDILHIINNPERLKRFTDRFGKPAAKIVGTVHGQTDRLAEIFLHVDGNGFIVFHAMETGERKYHEFQ